MAPSRVQISAVERSTVRRRFDPQARPTSRDWPRCGPYSLVQRIQTQGTANPDWSFAGWSRHTKSRCRVCRLQHPYGALDAGLRAAWDRAALPGCTATTCSAGADRIEGGWPSSRGRSFTDFLVKSFDRPYGVNSASTAPQLHEDYFLPLHPGHLVGAGPRQRPAGRGRSRRGPAGWLPLDRRRHHPRRRPDRPRGLLADGRGGCGGDRPGARPDAMAQATKLVHPASGIRTCGCPRCEPERNRPRARRRTILVDAFDKARDVMVELGGKVADAVETMAARARTLTRCRWSSD